MRNAKPARERERAIEHRTRRLLGALAAVLALAAIVAIGLSIYSFDQRRQALEAYSLSATANACARRCAMVTRSPHCRSHWQLRRWTTRPWLPV